MKTQLDAFDHFAAKAVPNYKAAPNPMVRRSSILFEYRSPEDAVGVDIYVRYKVARATADFAGEVYDLELDYCSAVYAWSDLRKQWTLAEVSTSDIPCGSDWFRKRLCGESMQSLVFEAINRELNN